MGLSRLTLKNISKTFDGNRVLKGIDLDIMPGDIVGLVGENGAGKSTCMNIVAGAFLQDQGGSMFLDGAEVIGATVNEQRRRGVRIIHQELSLAPSMSVAENIFLGDYRASAVGWVRRNRLLEATRQILRRVRADHIAPQVEVGTLRLGDQQLVEIAK